MSTIAGMAFLPLNVMQPVSYPIPAVPKELRLTTAVLVFGRRRLPRTLRSLPVVGLDDVTAWRRIVVVGTDAELATVLTRLLRADRLDIEVAPVRRRWQARRARTGTASRVPLIRDETGAVIVRAAHWLPEENAQTIHGEATVDDTLLFNGDVTGVRIEPMATMPGLRAVALSGRMRPRRWSTGRAAQLGTDGAQVVRDGVFAPRLVRRSTFYRHTEGWLLVR
jgi:hypothetical protein